MTRYLQTGKGTAHVTLNSHQYDTESFFEYLACTILLQYFESGRFDRSIHALTPCIIGSQENQATRVLLTHNGPLIHGFAVYY